MSTYRYANGAHIDRVFSRVGINAVAAKHDRQWVIIENGALRHTADTFDDICRYASQMIEAQQEAVETLSIAREFGEE